MTRFDLDMGGSRDPSEYGHWVRYEEAQRPWVGLTDEEVMSIAFDFDVPSLVVRTVEAKLKEKNSD